MEPRTDAGRAGLRAVLDHPGQALLALDFDGTLAPIVEDPEAAFVHPDALAVLARLVGCLGTVAVVTGRPVDAVRRLVGLDGAHGLDGLEVLGQYGVERWDATANVVAAAEPPAGVAQARAALPVLLERLGAGDVHVEDKGRALGVHVRRAADPTATFERLREPLAAFAAEHGLRVEPGKLVHELRAPGTDKGVALRALVAERAAGAVVFGGDDLGDLAAYDAVEQLRGDGVPGLLLCSLGDERTALADRADVVVDGPAGVVAWLAQLADSLEG